MGNPETMHMPEDAMRTNAKEDESADENDIPFELIKGKKEAADSMAAEEALGELEKKRAGRRIVRN